MSPWTHVSGVLHEPVDTCQVYCVSPWMHVSSAVHEPVDTCVECAAGAVEACVSGDTHAGCAALTPSLATLLSTLLTLLSSHADLDALHWLQALLRCSGGGQRRPTDQEQRRVQVCVHLCVYVCAPGPTL